MIRQVKNVIQHHKEYYPVIVSMAVMESKKQTLKTTFGYWWVIFRDIIHFSLFALIKIVMSGKGDMQGLHFLTYVISGKVGWFMISEVVGKGTRSIKAYKAVIGSSNFPPHVLPTMSVMATFIKRRFTYIFVLLLLFVFDDFSNFKPLYVLYYYFATFAFCIAYNMFFSSIVCISSDFDELFKAINSVLFITVPIIWEFTRLDRVDSIAQILKLNPMLYLVVGYRDAISSIQYNTMGLAIYFWLATLTLFIAGCVLQDKFSRHYDDLI